VTDPAADAPRHPLAEPAPIDADSVDERAEAAEVIHPGTRRQLAFPTAHMDVA
jgi:hypothetical protein